MRTLLFVSSLFAYFITCAGCSEKRLSHSPSSPVQIQDSTAWIKLVHESKDSIVVAVNGQLFADGACRSSVVLNLQKKENGEWKDCCGSSWVQMDCGSSWVFCTNQRFTFIPGFWKVPVTKGEYRFVVMEFGFRHLYSESFIYHAK